MHAGPGAALPQQPAPKAAPSPAPPGRPAGHVLVPLLLSYFYEYSYRSRAAESFLHLPRGQQLPPAVHWLPSLVCSTGWLLLGWALASTWPVHV